MMTFLRPNFEKRHFVTTRGDQNSFGRSRKTTRGDQNIFGRSRKRGGMATVMVLVLMSIALAVAYSMLRTKSTAISVKENLSRTMDARQAARTGMSTALRIIHNDTWQGVDVPIERSLNGNEWFHVSFETGDTSLDSNHPEHAEFPYRVTITSKGYAKDPSNPTVHAEHTIKVVVQLVRRQRSATPTNWTDLQSHTIYQWANTYSYVQVPVRTEGPVRLTGRLYLSHEYPNDSGARSRYLTDLNKMHVEGLGDFRPFTGPLDLRYYRQSSSTLTELQTNLGLTTNDFSGSTSAPISHPGTVYTYRLYPGGKEYDVPKIQTVYGSTLTGITLAPDAQTNPLGVFRSQGNLYLQDNATIKGTLLCYGSQADVHIYGDNVHLQPTNLPAIKGSTETVQMPTALVGDDLRVHEHSEGGSLTGLAVTWDDFEFKRGGTEVSFAVNGRLLVRELKLRGRWAWDISDGDWEDLLDGFLAQLDDDAIRNPVQNFPQWVEQQQGFTTQPALTVKPQTGEVQYHWQDWDEPIFVAHPDDDGLRWEVVSWKDG